MLRLPHKGTIKQLPPGFDVDTHFRPRYRPWEQRMCFVPDGDFFAAISAGTANVVTDEIAGFTPTGLVLRSGQELPADVIVTVTGLNLLPLGGIPLTVDGELVVTSEHVAYKGMMLSDVPNMAFAIGYTNGPWTLKVDLVSTYVVRLLRAMKARGYAVVQPRLPAEPTTTSPFIEMASGHFERARDSLPLQGDRAPWRLAQNFAKDARLFRGPVNGEGLEFRRARAQA